MAAPADVTQSGASETARDESRVSLNNVISALRIIANKLDADAGVTDTNYFALALDAAILTAPSKVNLL